MGDYLLGRRKERLLARLMDPRMDSRWNERDFRAAVEAAGLVVDDGGGKGSHRAIRREGAAVMWPQGKDVPRYIPGEVRLVLLDDEGGDP